MRKSEVDIEERLFVWVWTQVWYWQLYCESRSLDNGVGSCAAGGDSIAGAVNGMRIWMLNDAQHGAAYNPELDEILQQPYLPVRGVYANGSYSLAGVECVGGGNNYSNMLFRDGAITIKNVLCISSTVNALPNSLGTALINYGGNSTIGNNGKFYFHNAAQQGFYGNQYIQTTKLTNIGGTITKFTGRAGKVLDAGKIIKGYYMDSQTVQTDYYNIVKATTEVASGWVGAAYGASWGAKLGLSLSAFSGGTLSVPLTIIGSAVGGCVGAFGFEWISSKTVDIIYGK